MRDEEQGGHRLERVRGKHSLRCAPATGGVPMPKMRCIDRKVRAESRSLSRPTCVRQRVTVSPADLLSSRIVTLILGELSEYGARAFFLRFFCLSLTLVRVLLQSEL